MAKTSKAEIVRATQQLFREKGFAGTSMKDIGDRVGLLKPSLYSHFASKDALVQEVMTLTFEDVFSGFERSGDWVADYKKLVDRLAEMLTETRRCVGLHLAYGLKDDSEPGQTVGAFFDRCRDILRDVLEPGAGEAMADAFAADTLALIEGATLWLALRGDASSMERVQALLHDRADALAALRARSESGAVGESPSSTSLWASAREVALEDRVAELEPQVYNLSAALAGQVEAESCFK